MGEGGGRALWGCACSCSKGTCVYVGLAFRPERGDAPREPLPEDSSFSNMAGPLAGAGTAAAGGAAAVTWSRLVGWREMF